MGATIKLYKRLNKVTYYTVQVEGKELTEFNEFLSKAGNDPNNKGELKQLVSFIHEIGNNYGAVARFFKSEDQAFRFLAPTYIETEDPDHFGLRLYCLPVNENIVFIFNGCVKTRLKVRQCPNCSYHFHMANLISGKILEAVQDGFISVLDSGKELEIDENFELIF